MLKQITAPDHVIALSLDGTLTGEGLQEYRKVLEKKLEAYDHIGLYVDITNLTDMTANSIVEGTKADMELFSHIKQLNKCAFISDKEWPEAVISVTDRFFPTIEMKVFPSSKKEEALSWAAEKIEQPVSKEGAIRFLPTNKDDVLAFEIDGVLSANEMPSITKKLEKFLSGHDKVRLMARMKNFDGFDPSILIQSSGLLSMKIDAMNKVERYAIVGAPNWINKIVETANPVFPQVDIKIFTADQENEALAWLDAELVK